VPPAQVVSERLLSASGPSFLSIENWIVSPAAVAADKIIPDTDETSANSCLMGSGESRQQEEFDTSYKGGGVAP